MKDTYSSMRKYMGELQILPGGQEVKSLVDRPTSEEAGTHSTKDLRTGMPGGEHVGTVTEMKMASRAKNWDTPLGSPGCGGSVIPL